MGKWRLAARLCQILMGLVFLVSGGVKIWEPVLFYWDAVPYTQLLGLQGLWQIAGQVALLGGPLEIALGVALLVNWRPRLTFALSTLLMAFFLGLTTYAWKKGATEDCGCFGSLIERSPGEAAVEDGIMLGMLLFGWWGMRPTAPRRAGWVVVGGTVLALAVGGGRFFPQRERLEKSDLLPGVRLTGLKPVGLSVDLMKGEYLIELMSPRCGHCMEVVPALNRLTEEPDLPPLIALNTFSQDSAPLAEFKQRLEPRYPIGTISRTDFFRLTWKHAYPRLAWVRDGVVRQVWEREEFPTAEQLRAAIQRP